MRSAFNLVSRSWTRSIISKNASAARKYSSSFPVPPAIPTKHHVQTTLNYLKKLPNGQEPPPIYPFIPEKHDYSANVESVPVTIHDVAGDELLYNLDEHGFKFHYHKTKVSNFDDPEVVKTEYFPEVERMLKEVTGGKHVFCFNPIHRKPPTDPTKVEQGPVGVVHVDITPKEAVEGACLDIGPEAEQYLLLKGRMQIIHVWRPLKPVYKDPFAVADSRSIPQEDLISTKLIYPYREGSTFNVVANPRHRFYYRYGQTPDIVTLFKSFDSDASVAGRNPHSAFVDPDTVDHPHRESFELRAYVFH